MRNASVIASFRRKRSNPATAGWIASSACGLLAMTIVAAHAEDASVKTFCRLLPEYQQAPGVEYQPGVDVHGQFVAPADLPGQAAPRAFDSIEIPVEIDLIQRFNLNVPSDVELKPLAALISIHKDGRVDYNGQDISKQAHQLCENHE